MSLIASGKTEREYEKPPQGMHHMVCVDVVDMGIVENPRFQSKQHKCRIVWQLNPAQATTTDGRPFIISRFFTVSLNENSALRPFLEMWRGAAFTQDEIDKGIDLEKLLGVNGMGQIIYNTKDGVTYANLAGMMPLPKGMQTIQADKDYIRVQDREPKQGQTQGQAATQAQGASAQTQRFEQNRTPQAPSPPQPIQGGYDPKIDEIPF